MSYTFASPQLLKRYSDKTVRIVTHQKLLKGEDIVFKNENWLDERKTILDILEERPSEGIFENDIPTSYRLQLA